MRHVSDYLRSLERPRQRKIVHFLREFNKDPWRYGEHMDRRLHCRWKKKIGEMRVVWTFMESGDPIIVGIGPRAGHRFYNDLIEAIERGELIIPGEHRRDPSDEPWTTETPL